MKSKERVKGAEYSRALGSYEREVGSQRSDA